MKPSILGITSILTVGATSAISGAVAYVAPVEAGIVEETNPWLGRVFG